VCGTFNNLVFFFYALISLSLTALATEQYPKVFGPLVPELRELHKGKTFEKKLFSMLTPEVVSEMVEHEPTAVVLVGIETHICMLQTALDLLARGIDCHVVLDAASSQRTYDRSVAIDRLKEIGAFVTTTESIAYQLMGGADHPEFKAIAAHFRTAPTTPEFE
jgi:isochorismate hydrolase